MRTITIDLPNSLELNDQEARMVFASKLYEMGKLSLGQAAELAGFQKDIHGITLQLWSFFNQ